MGLMDKLRGELIDIIEWLDDSRDTMVYRFPRYQNEIKMGAKLVVRHKLRRAANVTPVFGVAHQPVNPNDHRFLHLVGSNYPHLLRPMRTPGGALVLLHVHRNGDNVFLLFFFLPASALAAFAFLAGASFFLPKMAS